MGDSSGSCRNTASVTCLPLMVSVFTSTAAVLITAFSDVSFLILIVLFSILSIACRPQFLFVHARRRLNAWAIFSIEIIRVGLTVAVPSFVIAVFAQFPQIAGIFNAANGLSELRQLRHPYRR